MLDVARQTSTIGRTIKRYRDLRGLSQDELARRAGVSSVAMIESGKRETPGVDTVAKIAAALGVTVEQLVHDEAEMPAALREFLASPSAVDVTSDELEALRAASFGGRNPIAASYFLVLQAYRVATKETP